jgi:hypothetical protein
LYYLFKKILSDAISKTINNAKTDNNKLLKSLESVILSFDENDPSDNLNLDKYPDVIHLLENLQKNIQENGQLDFLTNEREIQLIKSCFWYLKNLEESEIRHNP